MTADVGNLFLNLFDLFCLFAFWFNSWFINAWRLFEIYLVGMCERIGRSFRSTVCPRLSLYSRLVEDGNHQQSWHMFELIVPYDVPRSASRHQWEDHTPTSTPMTKIVPSVSFEKGEIPKCNLFRYSMGTSLFGNLYENRILLQLYTIMLKWLQWKGVGHLLGHRTGKQWSQPNQRGRYYVRWVLDAPRVNKVMMEMSVVSW
jgi:hypothetical protein